MFTSVEQRDSFYASKKPVIDKIMSALTEDGLTFKQAELVLNHAIDELKNKSLSAKV
jgi:hypothetical protein